MVNYQVKSGFSSSLRGASWRVTKQSQRISHHPVVVLNLGLPRQADQSVGHPRNDE
ncbi:MAG: hypothetical protein AAB817_00390 [Patescibacteria group bacterium]